MRQSFPALLYTNFENHHTPSSSSFLIIHILHALGRAAVVWMSR